MSSVNVFFSSVLPDCDLRLVEIRSLPDWFEVGVSHSLQERFGVNVSRSLTGLFGVGVSRSLSERFRVSVSKNRTTLENNSERIRVEVEIPLLSGCH